MRNITETNSKFLNVPPNLEYYI
jgi:hypothetical protein